MTYNNEDNYNPAPYIEFIQETFYTQKYNMDMRLRLEDEKAALVARYNVFNGYRMKYLDQYRTADRQAGEAIAAGLKKMVKLHTFFAKKYHARYQNAKTKKQALGKEIKALDAAISGFLQEEKAAEAIRVKNMREWLEDGVIDQNDVEAAYVEIYEFDGGDSLEEDFEV
ncbi:MAG: hypothetical protein F6J98_02090 [Moorea sp. SIO4G2]|nr:hypothetical protein [Moorena sp. SIO4G2]